MGGTDIADGNDFWDIAFFDESVGSIVQPFEFVAILKFLYRTVRVVQKLGAGQ